MWEKLKRKTQKGDKTMENYEVKGVSQATEIRKAYEEAVKANAPKYRAVSKTNLIYGWDEKANKFIKAEIGQEWFDNPHYVAPVEPIEEPIEEAVEPIEQMVEVANEMIEEVKAEEVKAEEVVAEKVEETDYKALYEEKCKELEEVKGEKQKALDIVDYYKQENEELKDGLSAFKTLLNKF